MRTISILGAPSNLGLKPYDDVGAARETVHAPAVLRELGLVDCLRARDRGDIVAAAYRDFERPPRGIRNEAAILEHAHRLADAVDAAIRDRVAGSGQDDFLLVLGGDCSVILGSLLGMRRRTERLGLAFIDGHGARSGSSSRSTIHDSIPTADARRGSSISCRRCLDEEVSS